MARLAVLLRAAPGEKTTDMVQDVPLLSEVGQLLVDEKSDALAPLNAIPLKVRGIFPVLLNVTVRGALLDPTYWFPKVREPGEMETAESGVTPVPLRKMFCGELKALSVIRMVAVRSPLA
jgi:hypothetical protein